MKKVAVACEGKMITRHFGHCANFTIFETEGKNILKEESIPNPGHKPGFLPNYLHDLGVNVVISGGMGGGAIDIFDEHEIDVVVGAEGDAREAVQKYLNGELETSGNVCNEHQFEGECNE